MAYVVAVKGGRFEIRESLATPKGPRSRTLASFTELTDEVLEKARARASKPLDPEELRRAARRSGAKVGSTPADRAARELIAHLAAGKRLDPHPRGLLAALLSGGDPGRPPSLSPEARAAAEWAAAPAAERGEALRQLLLLADALPSLREGPLRFPRLRSG